MAGARHPHGGIFSWQLEIQNTTVNCFDVSFHTQKKSLGEFLLGRGQSPTTSELVIGSLPSRKQFCNVEADISKSVRRRVEKLFRAKLAAKLMAVSQMPIF